MFESPLPARQEHGRHIDLPEGHDLVKLRYSVWSSASLKDVVALRQCKRAIKGHLEVIGLLLIYQDDSVHTVGQVRLGCLSERVEVYVTERLWLDVRVKDEANHYVANIELSGTKEQDPNWFEITWHGILDWELSCEACHVYHNRRSFALAHNGDAAEITQA